VGDAIRGVEAPREGEDTDRALSRLRDGLRHSVMAPDEGEVRE
jgi:hypothetical protein